MSWNDPLLTSKYLGVGSQSSRTPITRNSRFCQRSILPTLLMPPNAFWFDSLLSTTRAFDPPMLVWTI